ncbi:MAG: acyl dehydratase [Saccharospirillaceae bacterium]|nr:acyl dehydratase [Saccharospirillaceae bacterium]MCD8530370.1 acyl dehydratase [Saccharospirillaceae bacterium]
MTQAIRLQFSATPGTLSQYARALLARGAGQRDVTMPDIEALLVGVKAQPERVASYASVCGFRSHSSLLPLTYPHVLAFPLHMELMLHKQFPLALMGLVHIHNEITQYRAIRQEEKLDIRCHFAGSNRTDKGLEFDIRTEVTIGGERVWESVSTNLARMRSDTPRGPKKERAPLPGFSTAERWTLHSNLGRRYARVSGDSNPIHLYALSARLFGFKSHIAHGMWSKARTAAALQPLLGTDACRLTTEFKLPVFLPATVELNYNLHETLTTEQTTQAGIDFELRCIRGEKVHMKGRIEKI